jgi:hypothetical protein
MFPDDHLLGLCWLIDGFWPLFNVPSECEVFFVSERYGMETGFVQVVRSLDDRSYWDYEEASLLRGRENRGNNTTTQYERHYNAPNNRCSDGSS